MGFFANLFKAVSGKRHADVPLKSPAAERARTTAADEAAARKPGVSMQEVFERERKKLLENIGKRGETVQRALDAERVHEETKRLRNRDREELEESRRSRGESAEEAFLGGRVRLTLNIDFVSSNPPKPAVYQVWYVPEAKEMWVTFMEDNAATGVRGPGRTYKYWHVWRTEAQAMYQASSKGKEIWSTFRVRGSAILHKKNYAQVG